ncbi:MAG: lipocalin family protein [Bacteroidales bacterium]|nr:lipocalin family protein [Bacteroidales bacterium]
MNKIRMIMIMAFVVLSISAFAQNNLKGEYTKLIQGTWKVDSLEIGSFNLSPEYEEIVRQKMPEIIAMTEVQFNSRKKYLKKGFEGTKEGTWSISDDGQFVLVKLNGETKVSKTRIIKLTDEKMILAPEEANSANSKAYMYKAK